MNFPQLTFTRFLAASMVVFFHYSLNVSRFQGDLLHNFISQGSIAVSYFFVLSGLVMTFAYEPQKIDGTFSQRKFFIFRFARIAPLYYLAFIATLFFEIFLYHKPEKIFSVALQFFGLQAWVPGYSLDVNYVSWSVSVEFFFYLTFPILLNWMRKLSMKKLVLLSFLFWTASQFGHIFLKSIDTGAHYSLSQLNLYHPFALLSCFTTGISVGLIIIRQKEITKIPPAFSFIAISISIVALFFILSTQNFILPWVHNGLLAPIFLLLIIGLIYDKTFVSKIFSSKPLIFLGEISFGIYLLQHPVELAFRSLLDKIGPSESLVRFAVYFSLLIFISAITYLFFEKPVRKLIRNQICTSI